MAYPAEIIRYARDVLAQRKQQANDTLQMRKEQLYSDIPRLRDIETELSRTAAEALRSAFSPGGMPQIERLKAQSLSLQKERTDILKLAGLGEDFLDPPFVCKTCFDEGMVDGKYCHCFLKLLKEEAYRKLNEQSQLALCDFSNFDLSYYSAEPSGSGTSAYTRMRDIFSYCQRYAQTFAKESSNLLFMGKNGLGKTHLSLSIAKQVIEKGFGVIYGSAPDLLGKIEKERFSRQDENTITTIEWLLDCDLLVLDDLGAEFATSFSSSAVYQILNTRINKGLPSIISTNLTHEELLKIYGDRVVSRLIGCYETFPFLGQDVRQLKHYKTKK